MTITEFFTAQLEREATATRRVLERVPEGRNDWRPHEKSQPLGYLAALVAVLPSWIEMMVQTEAAEMTELKSTKYHPQPAATSAELLATLERATAAARAALAGADDARLAKPWRLLVGGHAVSEQPRLEAIADGVLSHLSHHRGQLTVYLRLLDAKVPGIFGPSADDNDFG